jgi:hypothetical protein
MSCRVGGLLGLAFLLVASGPLWAQGAYEVDLSAIEKEIAQVAARPYSLGGFVAFTPTVFGLDRDAALYRLRFFDQDVSNPLTQYALGLRPEVSYRQGIFSLFARADILGGHDYQGWDANARLFEGFGSLKPSPSLALEAGKKVVKWGKGYAWNPVAFVDRPKNPEDPEEALEGFYLATANLIRSFAGPIKTLAFTPVLLPVFAGVNDDFGMTDHVNVAAKLYCLCFDTDLDVMVFTGGSRTTRYGVDFAKNLRGDLEIHGEWAFLTSIDTPLITARGERSSRTADEMSALVGLRYLTPQDLTIILEYYYNGPGLTQQELQAFFAFVDLSYATFVRTGNASGLQRATTLAEGPYGRPNPMQHYVYLRASQKEPWNIVYFTPALTTIVNVVDHSFVLIPELLYSPRTNLELRLRGSVFVGGQGTEYGEKPYNYRLELRVRYYFQV